MTGRSLLVVLVVVALAVPLGVATAAQSGPAATERPSPQVSPQANGSANATFGTAVASFMQASAAEAEGEVGQGMFLARFNRTDDAGRSAVVRRRVASLDDQLQRLRDRRDALLGDANVTAVERARAAGLGARIATLKQSVNGTAVAAERAGLNVTALDRLREDARNLTGQEVAAIATGLADGGPPFGEEDGDARDDGGGSPDGAGPPADAGPPDESDGTDGDDATETPDGDEDADGSGGDS